MKSTMLLPKFMHKYVMKWMVYAEGIETRRFRTRDEAREYRAELRDAGYINLSIGRCGT